MLRGGDVGYRPASLHYVPISGFAGANLTEKHAELSWWEGPTLSGLVDSLPAPPRDAGGAPRLLLADAFRTGATSTATGKVEAGAVRVGDRYAVRPGDESAVVKSINARNASVKAARAGEYVEVVLPMELHFLWPGVVLALAAAPATAGVEFYAQILVITPDQPIVKGQQVMLYLGTASESATITKLVSVLNKKTGSADAQRPKCLLKGQAAVVRIGTARPVVIEPKKGKVTTALSRVVLRERGRTIAAGLVVEKPADKDKS